MLRKTFISTVLLFSIFVMMVAALDNATAQEAFDYDALMIAAFDNAVAQNAYELGYIEIGLEKDSFEMRRKRVLYGLDSWQQAIQGAFENEQLEKSAMAEFLTRYHKAPARRMNSNYRIYNTTSIEIDGKKLGQFSNKNFDFCDLPRLELIENEDALAYVELENSSFYGTNLEGAIFKRALFKNCCFKEANLRNVDAFDAPGVFFHGPWSKANTVFKDCDFTGAEISGAKFSSITRKQLLSTSNFRQYKLSEDGGIKYDRKRVNLADCTFWGLNAAYDGDKYDSLNEEFDLSGVDFNRFNNGKPTPAPLHAVGIGFGYFKMSNCNFRGANLRKAQFELCNLEKSNFTKTNLADVTFYDCNLNKCNFEDAEIKNTRFDDDSYLYSPYEHLGRPCVCSYDKKITVKPVREGLPVRLIGPLPAEKNMTAEQLKSTASYKRKELLSIGLGFSDLSGVDFSRFNLTGSSFMGSLQNANFTDAVITGCSFGGCYSPKCDFSTLKTNLTIEQIKSTWNYKTNNMTGIKLPAEIQKALDAEKNLPQKKAEKK
ncbi:MAG: pentapeptide repeat-containing protein [Planctomycetaceae bacterium]|jgi:uncharacterized protein YjbI with pentapeptide repeats|nr:pentapeptide repeat-containing protein [Planctomycetaceae bacterium]